MPLPICLQKVVISCPASTACCRWLCWLTSVNMSFCQTYRVRFSTSRVSFCVFPLGSRVGSRLSNASKEWNVTKLLCCGLNFISLEEGPTASQMGILKKRNVKMFLTSSCQHLNLELAVSNAGCFSCHCVCQLPLRLRHL